MNQRIADFVNSLAQLDLVGPVFNPYAFGQNDQFLAQANSVRRQNLYLYLEAMVAARPWLLLAGEAPGYRGCRLTGVPFTSEAIILDSDIWPFGAQVGFRKTAEHNNVVKEATATILWSAVRHFDPPPLLWNAFPIHPHRPGQPASNRRPNSSELHQGAGLLVDLLSLFRPPVLAAVGRSAAHALDLAGLSCSYRLRHPSHGGKAAFLAGLERIEPPSGRR
jgi:uracil-DNA glycosylase